MADNLGDPLHIQALYLGKNGREVFDVHIKPLHEGHFEAGVFQIFFQIRGEIFRPLGIFGQNGKSLITQAPIDKFLQEFEGPLDNRSELTMSRK